MLVTQADWGRGFLNPYASIYFTLTEALLLISGGIFLARKWQVKWRYGDKIFFTVTLLCLATLGLSLLFSPSQEWVFKAGLFVKAVETLILYFLVNNGILNQNKILKVFILVMTGEALLGIYQVLTQSSLGLSMLGEPSINTLTAHLAKIEWGGLTWVRAYGTLPHPNVLGGFLVISLLATFLYNPTKKYEREIFAALQFLGLLATCSRSGLLAFSIALFILSFWYLNQIKKGGKQMTLLLGFSFSMELLFLFWSRGTLPWNDPALLSRWEGFHEALALFFQHPLGVGWNHYTLFLDQASAVSLAPWEYQPVHNTYLLALTEMGIVGLITAFIGAIMVFKKIFEFHKTLSTPSMAFKKRVFTLMGVSILLIGLFDHYWMTLEQGRWLLALLWAMFADFMTDPLHVFPIKKEEQQL